jgi:hypothetical protein
MIDPRRALLCGALTLFVFGPLSGCARREKTQAAPSASGLPAPVASGFPAPELVSEQVNPSAQKAYAGPVGTVRGRVVATGDAPSDQPTVVAQIPPNCTKAAAPFAKLFREGPNRALADALVTVTRYAGYIPEADPAVRVEADGCFWGTRTIAVTYGQRLEIVSKDANSYVPELLGERGQPQIVATPFGAATSTVLPTQPGRFVLVDNLRLFMTAEVLVLKYPTHAVTGLDGRFEIPNVPVGQVTVSSYLPQTQATAERSVTVEAGKATEELLFELPFDAAAYARALADLKSRGAAGANAAGSGSARPAAPSAAPTPRAAPTPSAAPR